MSQPLERLALVLVDLDGTLTEENVNTWFEFTRYIFLLAGKPEMADSAVAQHGRYYGSFRDDVKVAQEWFDAGQISKDEFKDAFADAYRYMQERLFKLWSMSGLRLSKDNVQAVVRKIIAEKINPAAGNFIQLLQDLCKVSLEDGENVPVYVLTGAFSEIAQLLSEELGLSGGYANSNFIYETDADGIEVLRSFEHDHDLAANKIKHLFRLIQTKRSANGIDPKTDVVSIGDGYSDHDLFKHTYGIAVRPQTPELRRSSEVIVDNLDEAEVVIRKILPEDIKALLPVRTNS